MFQIRSDNFTYMDGPWKGVLGRLVVVQSNNNGRELGGELGIPCIVVLR